MEISLLAPVEVISVFSKPSLCITGAWNLSFVLALSLSHKTISSWRPGTVSPVHFLYHSPPSLPR